MILPCVQSVRRPQTLSRQHGPHTRRQSTCLNQSPLTRFLLIPLILLLGCNDPYSQRRIERRTAHLEQTATDLADRERDGVRRVREADETLKKWWKRDTERFERKAPTVGDYFW